MKISTNQQKTSPLLALLAAAVIKLLDIIMSKLDIIKIDKQPLGALPVFSAGALAYVGATHLLLQAETEQ